MARRASDIIREKIESLEKEIHYFQQKAIEYRWSSLAISYLNCVAKNNLEIEQLQKLLEVVENGWDVIPA